MRHLLVTLVVASFLTCGLVATSSAEEPGSTDPRAAQTEDDKKIDPQVARQIKVVQANANKLKRLAREGKPEGMTREQEAAWTDYRAFVKSSARSLDQLADKLSGATPAEANDMMQLTQLALQDAMNKQAQAFQLLSNIMKNQHDTAKSIINNMK